MPINHTFPLSSGSPPFAFRTGAARWAEDDLSPERERLQTAVRERAELLAAIRAESQS